MVQQKGAKTGQANRGQASNPTGDTKRYMDRVGEKAGEVGKKLDQVVR